MIKITSFIAALMLTVSPVIAETFYSKPYPNSWSVYGETDVGMNPACFAEYETKDKANVKIIKDLADGEIYAVVESPSWQLRDAAGTIRWTRIEIQDRTGKMKSMFHYRMMVLTNNRIAIRAMDIHFLSQFGEHARMKIILPDHASQSLTVPLTNSARSLYDIVECMRSYVPPKVETPQPPKQPEIKV